MKADTPTICGIFQRNTLLRVPYFQRRYVWGPEDWQRFAMDMEGTIESLQAYFLGAIILKEEEATIQDRRNGIAKKYLIIDGQQRLTTLSIYMKVLHMLTNKSDDFARQFLQDTDSQAPILTHNWEDFPAYCKVMHLDTPQDLSKENKIFEAYNFFKTYLLEARERGVNLRDLLNAVNASVTFVAISLDYQDDEQQIFDTINSLGVPLTTGELMKNFLYQANDEDKYNKNWKQVFDIEEGSKFWDLDRAKSRQEKGSKTSNIEIFFHAFVRIKMWDFKDKLSISQRKNFVKTSNVFSTCKAFVEIFGMDRQELADEIIAYAQLFRENFDTSVLDNYVPSYSSIKRIACLVNATKSYVVIPYILYILRNVDDELERNKIFGYIETYLIRRMLADSNSKSYSEFFSESLIANRMLTFENLKGFVESKNEDANLSMPNDRKVMLGITLREKSMDENTARILYYMFESKVRTPQDEHIQGFNEYQAEMFMPKANNGNAQNWPFMTNRADEEERCKLIGTLGNYFIMNNTGKKELKKIKDEAYGEKITILSKYGKGIRCNTILEQIHRWTSDDINTRNIELSKGFCKLFSI